MLLVALGSIELNLQTLEKIESTNGNTPIKNRKVYFGCLSPFDGQFLEHKQPSRPEHIIFSVFEVVWLKLLSQALQKRY